VQLAHWHPAVVVQRASGDAELSINDICNILRDQHGLFATDTTNRIPITVRLVSMSFWIFDTVLPQSYQILVRNLSDFTETARLTEFPARNQWGRIGFEWPVSQQTIQHDHTATVKPVKIDVTSSASWLLQVSVLWRSLNGLTYNDVATPAVLLDSLQGNPSDCSSEFSHLDLDERKSFRRRNSK